MGSLSLSLSLSLCTWVRKWFEVKIFTSNQFRVKAFKTHGQMKIISGKFIFHAQPNTRIYGKAFLEVIWSQNKHSLSKREVFGPVVRTPKGVMPVGYKWVFVRKKKWEKWNYKVQSVTCSTRFLTETWYWLWRIIYSCNGRNYI